MTSDELRQFYEKLYFHEIDARDKIQARLQLPLTLLLAVLGAVVFLFQNFDYQLGPWTAPRVMFVFFFCSGVVVIAFAMIWFVKALYNHSYYFLPDSRTTANYKKSLDELYENWPERDRLVSDAMDGYLCKYYIEFASFNTQVNDRRSAFIHLCNGAIIGAAVLFIFAYLVFYFGDLDKSKIQKPAEVSITKPIDVRIQRQGK
jgi:Na+/phosphate symporter